MNNEPLLHCSDLARSYAGMPVVRGIELQAWRGEVLGLLGVNGAGKTTTMDMLCGVLRPSAGRVTVCGYDLARQAAHAKRRLGYLPERPPLYPELTVIEYLRFCASLRGLRRAAVRVACSDALARCRLDAVADRLVGNLSRGYQQRVGLAQALLHDPAVIVLDEPTVGLDPVQLAGVRETVRELARDHAVVLSTHILPEVTALCDRVLILHDGVVVHRGGAGELTGDTLFVRCLRPPDDLAPLAALPGVDRVVRAADARLVVTVDRVNNPAPGIARLAVEHDWGLLELGQGQGALEQAFLNLTCGNTDTAAA